MSKSGIARLHGRFIFSFLRIIHTDSRVAGPSPPAFAGIFCGSADLCHSSWDILESQSRFDLHFLLIAKEW